jgi:hypothetical protein
MITATVSNRFHLEIGRRGVIAHNTTTGATIKIPVASASHQTTQVAKELPKLTLFARMETARVAVELIIAVGAKEMSANFPMLEGVANVL